MGIAQFPAASAAGKTRFQTTLNSGTSYTVPTGVNYLVVTCVGGGAGGPVASEGNANNASGGGTTSFTGATSASGGNIMSSTSYGSGFINHSYNGSSALAGTGGAGAGGVGTSTNQNLTGRFAPPLISGLGGSGQGAINTSIVNTSPGATINYSIGAGGSGANGSGNCGGSVGAGAGGSGRIDIEYWA